MGTQEKTRRNLLGIQGVDKNGYSLLSCTLADVLQCRTLDHTESNTLSSEGTPCDNNSPGKWPVVYYKGTRSQDEQKMVRRIKKGFENKLRTINHLAANIPVQYHREGYTKQDSFLAEVFTYHQGKKAKYEYERVLVGLLHRYALNFRTIYKCWGDFQNNSKFKFPIYTLLRPLIADHLLMMYLLEEFKWLVPTDGKNNRDEWEVNETDFVKRYENISTTFFERLDSYLKKKVKKSELSPADMQEFLLHQRNIYPEFFHDGPETQVRKQKSLTPAQMADQINYGKQFVKNLYDYYFRLSQFEHFTIITEGLMGDPDNDSELMYIVEITDHLLDGLNVNLSTIRVSEEFRNKTIELINGFRTTKWLNEINETAKA